MTLLLANIPATVCFIMAGILAYHGPEGWGWFLFVGMLTAHFANGRKDDDDEEEGEDSTALPTPPKSVIHRN